LLIGGLGAPPIPGYAGEGLRYIFPVKNFLFEK
jgi:hypothetical protein